MGFKNKVFGYGPIGLFLIGALELFSFFALRLDRSMGAGEF